MRTAGPSFRGSNGSPHVRVDVARRAGAHVAERRDAALRQNMTYRGREPDFVACRRARGRRKVRQSVLATEPCFISCRSTPLVSTWADPYATEAPLVRIHPAHPGRLDCANTGHSRRRGNRSIRRNAVCIERCGLSHSPVIGWVQNDRTPLWDLCCDGRPWSPSPQELLCMPIAGEAERTRSQPGSLPRSRAPASGTEYR